MTHIPTPPVWGTPPRAFGADQSTDGPADPPSQSWELRREIDDSDYHRFRHERLGVVTGTEQDAMHQLMEIAVRKAENLIKPSKGYRIAQEGTTLVVSPVKLGWGEPHYREYRFTAVRILMTVPPVEKKPKR